MNLLLHTIALEPARWTSARVFRPLEELLPALAAAGFGPLEIFEPHLTQAADENSLRAALARHDLTPVILSSYLDLSDTNPEAAFGLAADALLSRVDRFGFRAVRLFPGRSAAADRHDETMRHVAARLRRLAEARPTVQFLLETHDGSLADEPENMARLLALCDHPNLGLIWQPTRFDPAAARVQFDLQKPFIRQFHLQNRDRTGAFTTLEAGVIPWREFLAEAGPGVGATLEFVPRGICVPEEFDLAATIAEAVAELRWAELSA